MLVSVVSLTASWINWGFGLVVGALFAKELARQVRVDYRLLVASAYSGFVVWHGSLAGSVPLAIATSGHPFDEVGDRADRDRADHVAPFNLAIVAVLFLLVPTVNRMMLPGPADSIYVDPAKLDAVPRADEGDVSRPADWIETSGDSPGSSGPPVSSGWCCTSPVAAG